MMRTVEIESLPIRLDALIKLTGITGSGGQAKQLIQEGLVEVNGDQTTQRSKKIYAGDEVSVALDPAVKLKITGSDSID